MSSFQFQVTSLTLALLLLEGLGTAFGMWLLYLVIKYAIRDGIRESGLAADWRNVVRATRERQRELDRQGPDTLPDMRAER